MTKDEAEAIHALARQLLEEDVSVERRCRLARKIIEHVKTIKAACMAELAIRPHASGFLSACGMPAGWVPPDESTTYGYEFATDIPRRPALGGVKAAYLNGRQVWPEPKSHPIIPGT